MRYYKHPQTIGKLERIHVSLKTNLKIASVEYRRQWHKYLPLAVLGYESTYHSSIQQVLPYDKYNMRRLNTNKTQILHNLMGSGLRRRVV